MNRTRYILNKIFDKQIIEDKKYQTHKDLFNLTENFKQEDWKFIRTAKYWEKVDKMPFDMKKEYTLECVNYYIKHKV